MQMLLAKKHLDKTCISSSGTSTCFFNKKICGFFENKILFCITKGIASVVKKIESEGHLIV